MMKCMKMNTIMKWIHEWNWMEHHNIYRNETDCSLYGNEGTNQCIIECTKHISEYERMLVVEQNKTCADLWN